MDTHSDVPGEVRRDYLDALSTIRSWKTFFLVLIVLCILTHVGAWGGVRYGHVLEGRRAVVLDESGSVGATTPTTSGPGLAERDRAETIHRMMEAGLPLTEFVGRFCALLLCVSMLVAALAAVSVRLPAAGFVQSFFRALVALALLLPWDRLAHGVAKVPGVFSDLSALETPLEVTGLPAASEVLMIVRFVAYPLLAFGLLLYANAAFRRSYRQIESRPGANIAMRVV